MERVTSEPGTMLEDLSTKQWLEHFRLPGLVDAFKKQSVETGDCMQISDERLSDWMQELGLNSMQKSKLQRGIEETRRQALDENKLPADAKQRLEEMRVGVKQLMEARAQLQSDRQRIAQSARRCREEVGDAKRKLLEDIEAKCQSLLQTAAHSAEKAHAAYGECLDDVNAALAAMGAAEMRLLTAACKVDTPHSFALCIGDESLRFCKDAIGKLQERRDYELQAFGELTHCGEMQAECGSVLVQSTAKPKSQPLAALSDDGTDDVKKDAEGDDCEGIGEALFALDFSHEQWRLDAGSELKKDTTKVETAADSTLPSENANFDWDTAPALDSSKNDTKVFEFTDSSFSFADVKTSGKKEKASRKSKKKSAVDSVKGEDVNAFLSSSFGGKPPAKRREVVKATRH